MPNKWPIKGKTFFEMKEQWMLSTGSKNKRIEEFSNRFGYSKSLSKKIIEIFDTKPTYSKYM